MNIPNRLTIIRVILVPFFVFFLLFSEGGSYVMRIISLIIFCIASFTDFLDGYIARRDNLVTTFGKFMDPLADKLLVCSALVCLVELGDLPAWVVIIVISREFIISGFRLVASDAGVVISASYWGKFKTVSQIITIILLILDIHVLLSLSSLMVVIMVALTIISMVDYIIKNRDIITEGEM